MAETDIKNLKELEAFIAKNGTTLVDFHATWCGPCKAIAPYVHDQCKSNGIPLAKVDVDEASDVAAKFKIEAMPTFKVLGAGLSVIAEVVGGGNANVDKMIKAAVAKK